MSYDDEWSNGWNDHQHAVIQNEKIKHLEMQNAKLKQVLKMVEDNSLMPHKHTDYYTRLCCLAERASEVLKELE